MTASKPEPSAAYSTIWNEAPFTEAVYDLWPTTPRATQPAGIRLYVPASMGTRIRGRLTTSPRDRAANISSRMASVSSIVMISLICASVRYRAMGSTASVVYRRCGRRSLGWRP
jgi:hypothetical protein